MECSSLFLSSIVRCATFQTRKISESSSFYSFPNTIEWKIRFFYFYLIWNFLTIWMWWWRFFGFSPTKIDSNQSQRKHLVNRLSRVFHRLLKCFVWMNACICECVNLYCAFWIYSFSSLAHTPFIPFFPSIVRLTCGLPLKYVWKFGWTEKYSKKSKCIEKWEKECVGLNSHAHAHPYSPSNTNKYKPVIWLPPFGRVKWWNNRHF